MIQMLARHWWALVLRGLLAVVFGVMALFWPGITVATLVLLFGAYAFVDGVFAIAAAARGSSRGEFWPLLVEGLLGIGAGIVAFVWPAITALALLYLIGAWSLLTGAMELFAAVRLRRHVQGEVLLALSGIASIAFGLIVLFRPGAGALALVWLIAAYALFFGILLIGLGVRLRSLLPRDTRHRQDTGHGSFAGPSPVRT